MDELVDYENFEKLLIVKRLRQIIGDWWKIQINFTDAKGYLRGVSQGKFFSPHNQICQYVTEEDEGFNDCRQYAKMISLESFCKHEIKIGICHAGFSSLSLPIKVNTRIIGAVFADGFLIEDNYLEQKEKIKEYLLNKFKKTNVEIDNLISELPILSKKDLGYLQELLEVVIKEVVISRKKEQDLDAQVAILSEQLFNKYDFGKMLGNSVAMRNVFKLLTRVCEADSTILITGENGTGKEGIARAIHVNSKRKNNAFVIQNCGAINENLLESELFGHVKGSFTSAIKDKKGLFELADRGTLFLDEIGDTSPSMQVKLLRVLQEGTFMPVGGSEEKKVDVRVLVATNKKLELMVKDGTFREDLYYRLNVINVKVPPLRERKDDIIILANKFLQNYAEENKVQRKKLQTDCLKILENYDWPGNVRELQNEIERLCVLSGIDGHITSELISDRILTYTPKIIEDKFPGSRLEGKLKDALEDLEKKFILNALIRDTWNKSKASKRLGISRAGLIMKCEKYELDRDERFKKAKE